MNRHGEDSNLEQEIQEESEVGAWCCNSRMFLVTWPLRYFVNIY